MTPMLVSLAQSSADLRRDTSDDDADLTLKIRAASAAVLNYIRSGADAFTDSAGDAIVDSAGDPVGVPEDVQFAVLLLVREFYKPGAKEWTPGYLPPAVVSLLTPFRDPVVA